MKIKRIVFTFISLLLLTSASFAQDKRTLDTKVADLLVQFPANDPRYTDKLMNEMISFGEEGLIKICRQIVPAGKNDDTKARFAVESLSRYLSQTGKEAERPLWEEICISFATSENDSGVKDFFMKQLQMIGSDKSAEALKIYLSDKEICSPAVAAISAARGKKAEYILAESLKTNDLPCAAAVMNALAGMKSSLAVNEYILWSSNDNINIKASAYNALAQCGSPLAYPVLLKAAKASQFRWESTGATSALLNYAKTVARNGDLKSMDKICNMLIIKCNDKLTIQNKTEALATYVSFHGVDAMPLIFKASSHADKNYRNASINMTSLIPGNQVVKMWIDFFPRALPEAKPEIITMLGTRMDNQALPLIISCLEHPDISVRCASAEALSKLNGKKAAPGLAGYMMKFDSDADQEAAVSAFKSIAGNEEMNVLRNVLKDGSVAAKKSAIELMAWNTDHAFFSEVLPYASSESEPVRKAALKALQSLAGPEDQNELINLLAANNNPEYISDLQDAIAAASVKIADPEKRSTAILKVMDGKAGKEKLVPILSRTGGREALATVLKEFENGNPEMREICFKTLTAWTDYHASSALFEICASGNKTYEAPAFDGYVRQIKTAEMTDENKLLLCRKIMPYALSSERKNSILTEAGKLKTYQSLFFISGFLDDPSTSAAAAKAAMSVALPSASAKDGMSGNIVRDILTKTVLKLSGPESEYDKEMVNKYLSTLPPDEGFKSMFNGKNLEGWQGLVENPVARAKMKPEELAVKQIEADKKVPLNWSVKDGCIWFNGNGENLCSVRNYENFEMLVDWKISKKGDSGIYLRGSPQVQIWDTSRVESGAQVGSGGLYNNQKNPSKPLKVADNPIGDWNTFRILMTGEKVSVWLNGELVVDNVTLENYWDRNIPIFPEGPVELQAHGTDLAFRDIYIREIIDKGYKLTPEEKAEGFVVLFNGKDLDNWVGDKVANAVEDGMIVTRAEVEHGGNIYTEKEYADFIFRFDFLLSPGGNNGLGIRAPLNGDAAYVGMELQILDNTTSVFGKLQPYQMHGSVYGVIPAKTGYLKPLGEWNSEEVVVIGNRVKVILNGTVILDGDIAEASKNGTIDHRDDHSGLKNKTGHIGFLYHQSVVKFRNIRIKDLSL